MELKLRELEIMLMERGGSLSSDNIIDFECYSDMTVKFPEPTELKHNVVLYKTEDGKLIKQIDDMNIDTANNKIIGICIVSTSDPDSVGEEDYQSFISSLADTVAH